MSNFLASSDARRRWLLVGVWAFAWAALAYLRWSREPYLLDDAFISFRYARNLVDGHGLVYNPGERVEGYTNFLWTLFAAGFLRVGIDPLLGTRVLGVASYLLSTALAASLVVRDCARLGLRTLLALAAAPLALILPAGYAGFAGTGMETAFVGLLGLALGICTFLHPPRTRGERVLIALLGMALVATRLDCVPWVALAAGMTLWQPFHREPARATLRARLAETLGLFGPAAVTLAAMLLGRLLYYGEILPNTYWAKVEGSRGLDVGWRYLQAYLAGSPQVFVALTALAAGLWLARSGDVRRFLLYGGAATVLHALYLVSVGGDFMHYRLMFHVYPLFAAAAIAGLVVVEQRSAWFALVGAGALALTSLAPTVLDQKYHMESLEDMYRCCGLPGVAYGRRLAEALPKQTVIATTMAGGVAYYSNLQTIDQLGLTDREVARHGVLAKQIRRGHTKRAPISYLRRRGVNLVLDHPTQCSCRRPCTNQGAANVFIRMEGDACLRTLYLTRTVELSQLFCSDPHDFVVTGLDCAAVARSERELRRNPG